ncbi:hypothetical protein PtA15_7A44 [Puccinia triticina]|uniref:Uncharacterized protein n=1 Tax=Puccinia triticina TaxID=208348 RepID=A0ABY7CM66_9BASI|nr:uncharacterized protein PtA15_7A44 [Puccinia triticina]WAQ86318.1 hypothetical protein PtA15_7A44 [Puccinia triticina]WAR56195.1 hypothetical protein PtB15_7B40 [Puccinia triticina]
MPHLFISPYAKLLAVEFWKENMPTDDIKRILHINFSISLIYQWVKLFENTGCVVRNPDEYEPRGTNFKIPDNIQDKLREYLEQNPTAYLDELQEWLYEQHEILVCISTIDNTL